MIAKILMVVSTGTMLSLGVIHLVYTFWGTKLTPRDPELQIRMSEVSPVISRETTMWKLWIGFNASHSFGTILFGLLYGYLALCHGELLFKSPFLLVVGFAMLAGLAFLSAVYWFSAPLRGVCIALACYAASIACSRA
jgi:hypothetical protein